MATNKKNVTSKPVEPEVSAVQADPTIASLKTKMDAIELLLKEVVRRLPETIDFSKMP